MKNTKVKAILLSVYNQLYPVLKGMTEDFEITWLRLRYRVKIMNALETISYIQDHSCGVSRFGDGEMNFVLGENWDIAFQPYDREINIKLKEVLQYQGDNLLICIPRYWNGTHECTKNVKKYWHAFFSDNHKLKRCLELIHKERPNYLFGDSLFSRPYLDIQNRIYAKKVFNAVKSLWNKKNVLVVEGEKTRLGVGNDLLDNARGVERIIAPAVNAFEKRREILLVIEEYYRGQIVLLALGPTATILAMELAEHGIQAIDIGHIDVEYEWFLMGAKEKVPIRGKYVNESIYGRNPEDINDVDYSHQIVGRVL